LRVFGDREREREIMLETIQTPRAGELCVHPDPNS
jgi:hypothetical protein